MNERKGNFMADGMAVAGVSNLAQKQTEMKPIDKNKALKDCQMFGNNLGKTPEACQKEQDAITAYNEALEASNPSGKLDLKY